MSINRFTVQYSAVVPSGSTCSNPTITPISPQNITIPCSTGSSVDLEINTAVPGPYCLTFLVDCQDSCSTCGQIEVTKCFCLDGDDCGGCESCVGNLCVSTCATGKVCDNDTCVDCTADSDCVCNSVCSQGTCQCENGKKKRADGCCVECFDGEDLGNCLICIGGEIVAIDCPNGHCDPNTGKCQECFNNSHCPNPNECCNGVGACSCCSGYILDPVTNQCVPEPPCTNAQYCEDNYGKCSYCTVNGCDPKICPAGFVCNPDSGDCVPQCGNCPEGSGCINDICVPCSELSCLGVGLLCQYAVGCECNGTVCEYINCNPDNVDLSWDVTTSTQGTIVSPGQPSLQGTTSITPATPGMVYLDPPTGSGYYNHNFTLGTNGTSGNWTLYTSPVNTIALGSGTTKTFDLTATGPNMTGFVVKFVETGTGRTATWAIYRTPGSPFDQPNVWNYEFTSTGTNATTTGGTSGSVRLCSTNGNFQPTGVTNVQTTGDIVISFVSDGNGCLLASISGCGTWNGDVILHCGGTNVTVHAPEFTRDPANCCDPVDPNCGGWGTGEPCGDLTIQPITLVATPTFGHAASGDGEFYVEALWASAGLSFLDFFFLNPSDGCWSVSNIPTGDAAIVTGAGQSPFGPSSSNLAVFATMGDGGCVRLGYTCELRISGCKKLQGEVCLTECQAFQVNIISLGANSYTAEPSVEDEVVTYQWSVIGGGTITNPTGQTITLAPAGGNTTLVVTARYGSPVKCIATDTLILSTTIPGCTNAAACNYNSAANINDNSCVLVSDPHYDCVLGGFQPGLISALPESTPTIVWKIGGIAVATNQQVTPGTHTVDVFFNGIQKCSKTLVVPQCYRCNASRVCVPAVVGNNVGFFTTTDCKGACDCGIEITTQTSVCNGNRSGITIGATGDTGVYTVAVYPVPTDSGPIVMPQTGLNTGGSVTTLPLCQGTYRVVVTGATCDNSKDVYIGCNDCEQNTAALTNIAFDCNANYQIEYNIASDSCTTSYTVQLLSSDLSTTYLTKSYTNVSSKKYENLGAYPGDGNYVLKLTAHGCTRMYDVLLDCNGTASNCIVTSAGLTAVNTGNLVSFTATYIPTIAGSYTVKLYNVSGGTSTCQGASVNCGSLIDTIVETGIPNVINTTNFPEAITTPGIRTCYAVVIQPSANVVCQGLCSATAFTYIDPTAPPLGCSMAITNVSYNTTTGNVLLTWDGAGTSNDVTVQIQVSNSAVCAPGDPIVVNITGNGENGNAIPFTVPQINGVTQCIKVTIFDTNNASCADSATASIPPCTCSIVINESSVVVNSVAHTMEFTYTSRCTSGTIDYDVSGGASGSGVSFDGSQTGVTITHPLVVLNLVGYPSVTSTATLEISDDADVSCIDTYVVTLPGNCVGCALVGPFHNAGNSIVGVIKDISGNNVINGIYPLLTPTNRTTLQTAIQSGVVLDEGNFCSTGAPVTVGVGATGQSGAKVNQDSANFVDLNYTTVTSPLWLGSKKMYFGDCGCSVGRLCNYTTAVDFSTDPNTGVVSLNLYYADNVSGFTRTLQINIGFTNSIDATVIASIQSAIQYALTTTATCQYTVGSVVVTWNAITEILTINILGTNAGLGIIYGTNVDGLASNGYFDFTQSGCV